jgi:hypothetical protein
MYIPEENANLTGKICANEFGVAAYVSGLRATAYGIRYEGLALDGSGTWRAYDVVVLDDDPDNYYDNLYAEELDPS